ncbi:MULTISPECIES: hypothetical protein [unclassified Cryobacterium]|uniref:hypothetical protein n=1 Tax=unclassified Cryobacterium TaxID=2649013 RepID=UPI00106AD3CB|nr:MULTISPECIES: hypothetical protein [unclassified Cryobacterium]TFB96520.1 hypothetical protein E3O39_10635 [Cryobacterium sp. MDB2-A-1]TFC12805.1 hypothetical protein E3O35_07800 [Cryobacterium sp. MDB2-A-2]
MVNTIYPVDAAAGAPSYGGRMLRQVNAVAFAGATSARPLGGRSGVRPGTSTSTVSATSTTWTCGAFSGVADLEAAAESGMVTFSFDAIQTGSITAASASIARQDLIYVQLDIPVEDGSTVPVATVKYIAGTVAATDPALPVSRAFPIARINVPVSGGGSPTVTWIAPYAVAAGGIIPCPSSASYPASPYKGQMVYDISLNSVWIHNGTTWKPLAAEATTATVLAGFASGWSAGAQMTFSKRAGMVVAQINAVKGTAITANEWIGTCPSGFAPETVVRGGAAYFGSGESGAFEIRANGDIFTLFPAATGATQIHGSVSYYRSAQ